MCPPQKRPPKIDRKLTNNGPKGNKHRQHHVVLQKKSHFIICSGKRFNSSTYVGYCLVVHVGDFLIFLDLEHENVSLVVESQNSASRKVIFNEKKNNLSNNGTYNCTLQFEMKKVPDKYVEIIIYTPM